jgi:hypothetical protein
MGAIAMNDEHEKYQPEDVCEKTLKFLREKRNNAMAAGDSAAFTGYNRRIMEILCGMNPS